MIVLSILLVIVILGVLSGIRIIRPTERGLVETLGKYTRLASPGFNFVIPIFQRIVRVNVTERMTDIEPQEIITKDNLNAKVDLVVYFKIKSDEESVKNAIYQVNDVLNQLDTLARTTARNVIGTMPFKDVNSERNILNKKLRDILVTETKGWGVEVLKVELKDINPPKDVQETMNKVIKAENEKDSAIDFATAVETKADGEKRARIKEAEGLKQSSILVAEGQAKAFELVNEAFKGNAQKHKELEVTQASFQNNAKIILGQNSKNILKLLNLDNK